MDVQVGGRVVVNGKQCEWRDPGSLSPMTSMTDNPRLGRCWVTCSRPPLVLSPFLSCSLFFHYSPLNPSSIMSAPLTKVDSAIAGLSISDEKAPPSTEKEVKKTHRRGSSQAEGIWNIKDLGESTPFPCRRILPDPNDHGPEEQKIEISLPIETQKTGWYAGSCRLVAHPLLREHC